jgi:hypothetical protein
MITVLDELDAVRHALKLAEPDDLVVICADEITAVWKEVIYFQPRASPGDPRHSGRERLH